MSREGRRRGTGMGFGDVVQRAAIAPGKRPLASTFSKRGECEEHGQRAAPYRAIEFPSLSWDTSSSEAPPTDARDAIARPVQRNGSVDSADVDVQELRQRDLRVPRLCFRMTA